MNKNTIPAIAAIVLMASSAVHAAPATNLGDLCAPLLDNPRSFQSCLKAYETTPQPARSSCAAIHRSWQAQRPPSRRPRPAV